MREEEQTEEAAESRQDAGDMHREFLRDEEALKQLWILPDDITALDLKSLRNIVNDVREALWPDGDAYAEWSPDTLQQIAEIFEDFKLRPKEEEDGAV